MWLSESDNAKPTWIGLVVSLVVVAIWWGPRTIWAYQKDRQVKQEPAAVKQFALDLRHYLDRNGERLPSSVSALPTEGLDTAALQLKPHPGADVRDLPPSTEIARYRGYTANFSFLRGVEPNDPIIVQSQPN